MIRPLIPIGVALALASLVTALLFWPKSWATYCTTAEMNEKFDCQDGADTCIYSDGTICVESRTRVMRSQGGVINYEGRRCREIYTNNCMLP